MLHRSAGTGSRHWNDETHTLGVRLGRFFLWSGIISITLGRLTAPKPAIRPGSQPRRHRVLLDYMGRHAALLRSDRAGLLRRASGGSGRLTVQQSKTDKIGVGRVPWINPDSMTALVALVAFIYQVQTLTTQLDELTARVQGSRRRTWGWKEGYRSCLCWRC